MAAPRKGLCAWEKAGSVACCQHRGAPAIFREAELSFRKLPAIHTPVWPAFCSHRMVGQDEQKQVPRFGVAPSPNPQLWNASSSEDNANA